jgi:REP element-mobilizing transposase RayT
MPVLRIMAIDFNRLRDSLKQFDFHELFVNDLGWSQPTSDREIPFTVKDVGFVRRQIAQLAGVVVFEVTSEDGRIPDAKIRAAVHKDIAKQHHENLILFVDLDRTQSLWYWVKRQEGKTFARDHLFVKGQPGDLFLSKLGQIVFDIGEFDEEGNVSVVEVARRLRAALDVEKVTKRFYGEFQEQHIAFLELIRGVADDRQRRWYASVLLNRLMFIYFLQKKRFLDGGDVDYLKRKLAESQRQGRNQFFSGFLKLLFFEGFAKPEEKRSAEARERLGSIKYLNGGLFLPHHVEQDNPKLDVPDKAFENLFALFEKYSWNLNDTPGGNDNEINPDVLGYIFEKYINQKAFGAYYTRTEITEYLCERTIHRLILDAVNTPGSLSSSTGFQPVIRSPAAIDPAAATDTGRMPVLQEFDPEAELDASQRNLPHWRQLGATYFVTFRLADSLPQDKLRLLRQEREQWLKANPAPRSTQALARFHELFSERIEQYLAAGYGACWMRRPEISQIVETALLHFDGQRYDLGRFVVMPNHVHVLVTPRGEHELSDILHSWKSFTANEINKAVGRRGRLWQDESFDRIVRDTDEFYKTEAYIADNPDKAGLSPGEFRLGGRRTGRSTGFQPVNPANSLTETANEQIPSNVAGKGAAKIGSASDTGWKPVLRSPGFQPGALPFKVRNYQSLADLLMDLDASLCKQLLHDVLPQLSLLDPACGSGAFLVAAMKTLINVYAAVIGKIKFLADRGLSDWLTKIEREHKSVNYFIKKKIITDNLYGVDIMEEATEIARLRLFLALVAAAESVEQLEPLPNIDFNILPGNSLIGLMRVEDADFETRHAARHPDGNAKLSQDKLFRRDAKQVQRNMFRRTYRQVLEEKNRLIDNYRHAATYAEDLTALRDNIEEKKREALDTLNDLLLAEFNKLGIKYEQATWDEKKRSEGKPEKKPVAIANIEALQPFHWGFEFDEIINKRGGFDAIITNPPWETLKPYAKEFFDDHSELVTKLFMKIEDFEEEKARLLKDSTIRTAWLDYLSQFSHQSAWFRAAPQFANQISVVKGKRVGTDVNLYKLFVEQCFNLLRDGGRCGIITPGSIYNDLGAKQLRELLFSKCEIDSLFGLQNERFIFEGVDHRQKFCVLSFRKGGSTESFRAAFRITTKEAVSPAQLDAFFESMAEHILIPVSVIRRLSPDSLSLMEFKSDVDMQIAERASRFPLLGATLPNTWSVRFHREFDMTNDSDLFKGENGLDRLPLYEGKMIHQFDHRFAMPKYWLVEREARKRLLGKEPEQKKLLAYQSYRLGFRDVARNTDARTAIMTMLPCGIFCNHKLPTALVTVGESETIDSLASLALCSIMNSMTVDYLIRQRVTTNLTFIVLYQMPVPRISANDVVFESLVLRAAKLVCTTPEFETLAKEVGLTGHKQGVTDPVKRAQLRAELDGLVAQLYGLTEEEFRHILSTFPLVPDPVKLAAHNAYRDVERGLIK